MHDPTNTDLQWPAFAEITGVGACWADLTRDGLDDLYIANQRYNELNPYAAGFNDLFDPTNRFYANNGNGTFTDRTADAGVDGRSFDFGCSAVDFDGDGEVDLLVYGWGHVTLYRNNGDGTFTDVTQAAGLDVSTACLPFECWTSCSAWADYNGNGWLDLFVCTFVESHLADGHRSPGTHVAQLNLLFRNNGDGTFTEVAAAAGVEGIAADALGSKSWGAVWLDANLNGWPDLYVVNDMTPNEFYWNNGDGTFTRDDEAGLYDHRASMGVTSGDTTRSGYPDLYFTHYAFSHNGFYENRGDGTFVDRSGEGGLAADWSHVGWGTHFVDLDRDGHLDIVAANGGTEWVSTTYNQQTLVFQQEPQEGGGTAWVDRSNASGPGVLEAKVSRGAAFADYDLDGNVDVFIGNNANQTAQLLKGSGNVNNWLYVQPVQPGPNHQAVGARVIVETGGVKQYREIQAGSSFLSQNSLLADFGIGAATIVDQLTIEWPHGDTTVLQDLPANRVVRVDRATGDFETDTLSPLTQATLVGERGTANWFRSAVEVTLVAQDRAVGPPSGVAGTLFRFNDGPWQEPTPEGFVVPAVEGEHWLEFRSVDAVGNLEPLRRERIGVDLTPPGAQHEIEGTAGANGWWFEADLHLHAWDDLSGVDKNLYRIDDGPWERYLEPLRLQEGVQVVEYQASDHAGNRTPVEQVSVMVDAIPPEVAFLQPAPGVLYLGDTAVAGLGAGPAMIVATVDAAGRGGNFTLTLAVSDDTSGVDRVSLWLNGEQVARFLQPAPEVQWVWDTTRYASGTYLFQAIVQDVAGNVAVETSMVNLVSGTPGGVLRTVEAGPSLYPFGPGGWPLR